MKHLFSKHLREIGILFSIAMPFILFSCQTNLKDETGKAVVVKIAQPTENEIKLSLIADSLVYIPLETQNDLLIGQITKLSVSDNYLYVLDEITSNVFCFTHDGKFVRKIGNRGVGPGEYVEINDVTTYSQQVYLWDGNLRKIFIYDGESGELKQEVKTDYWAEYIHVIDDSWIIIHSHIICYNLIELYCQTDLWCFDKQICGVLTNRFAQLNDCRLTITRKLTACCIGLGCDIPLQSGGMLSSRHETLCHV